MELSELIGKLKRARVTVLGDVMLDRYVRGEVKRISPEAPVQVLEVLFEGSALGGAANVAKKVEELGGEAVLLGVVGRDESADEILRFLAQAPRLEGRLESVPDRPTTLKTRYVSRSQQVLRVDRESRSPVAVEVEDKLAENLIDAVSSSDALVISDYGKGVCTPRLIRAGIAEARKKNIPVVVDPSRDDFEKYAASTVLVPNEREAMEAAGEGTWAAVGSTTPTEESLLRAAKKLLARARPEALAVTRGPKGISLFFPDGACEHVPTRKTEVFDVTGAGDAVCAVFALALASGYSFHEASRAANLGGGIVVAQFGTGSLSREALQRAAAAESESGAKKLLAREHAVTLRKRLAAEGRTVAFTNGCFDLFHSGHVKLLEHARAAADVLFVGLNSDRSVRAVKGEGRPILAERERTTLLSALSAVDYIVVFDEESVLNLVVELKPDVLVKGGDYDLDGVVGAKEVEAHGGKVELVPPVKGISTTEIVRRVQGKGGG